MREVPDMVDLFIWGVLTDWRIWAMMAGLGVIGFWFRPRKVIV